MTLEDKLREIEERLNRLENKLKVSLFEMEKMVNQPKQEEPVDERLLEMEDLILLLQLENTKMKDKINQDIDIELTPKVSQSVEDRITRLEEEIGNIVAPGAVREIKREKPAEEEYSMRRKPADEEEHAVRRKPEERRKKHEQEDEEETVRVRGNVLEDLQKILNK